MKTIPRTHPNKHFCTLVFFLTSITIVKEKIKIQLIGALCFRNSVPNSFPLCSFPFSFVLPFKAPFNPNVPIS